MRENVHDKVRLAKGGSNAPIKPAAGLQNPPTGKEEG